MAGLHKGTRVLQEAKKLRLKKRVAAFAARDAGKTCDETEARRCSRQRRPPR
jgi:hypothetical protein